MPLEIIRNDITKMNVDAIVNPANTSLQRSGGICGMIFNAAGADRLQEACNPFAPIQAGTSVITKGFSLPAKYIIHTAVPINSSSHDEEAALRSYYKSALELAKIYRCKSIAFPLITKVTGHPKCDALNIATNELSRWQINNDMVIYLVVFSNAALAYSGRHEIKQYVSKDFPYIKSRPHRSSTQLDGARGPSYSSYMPPQQSYTVSSSMAPPPISKEPAPPQMSSFPAPASKPQFSLPKKLINQLDEPFSATLLRMIDMKGKTDVEVYKRANLDRKLFSKIRKGKGYLPSKKTVVALAISLELSLNETHAFLMRAGFALSPSVLFDVIVEYFIGERQYDIFEINNVLFEYDQPTLGG